MKYFCAMPWYSNEMHFVNRKETPCCWIQEPVDVKQLQQEFIAGQQPKACNRCWDSENNNVESRRQMENRFLDFKLDQSIENIQQKVIDGQAEIVLYQFYLGPLCNSTCVTCGPGSSTAWQSLLKNQQKISIQNHTVNETFEHIRHTVNWKSAQRINLLGGEPLLIQQSYDILNELINVQNTKCLISFVTNGSVSLTDKHKEMFKQFENISCCVSIDGIGKTFEYLRYPLKWNQLLDNLVVYKEIFREVTASFTISNMNLHEKDSIIQWFDDNNLRYIENRVYSPDYFNLQVYPGHKLWSLAVEQIQQQDKLKGIHIDDYIPYVADLINERI